MLGGLVDMESHRGARTSFSFSIGNAQEKEKYIFPNYFTFSPVLCIKFKVNWAFAIEKKKKFVCPVWLSIG